MTWKNENNVDDAQESCFSEYFFAALFLLANFDVLINLNNHAQVIGWNPIYLTTTPIFAYRSTAFPISYLLNFPFIVFCLALIGNLGFIFNLKKRNGEILLQRRAISAVKANLWVAAAYALCTFIVWVFFISLGNTAITDYSPFSFTTSANQSFPMLPFYAFWPEIATNLYYATKL